MTTVPFKKYLTTDEPYKPLTHGMKRDMGRNAFGRITVRHKGGGHKKLYREVDFVYNKKNVPARLITIEYDPFRTGFIALAQYNDGEKRYVLVPLRSAQVEAQSSYDLLVHSLRLLLTMQDTHTSSFLQQKFERCTMKHGLL